MATSEMLHSLMNYSPSSENDRLFGVTSKQTYYINTLPKKCKCLVNNYVEYNLFTLKPENIGDAITNIECYLSNDNNLHNNKAELVFKINDNVICSKLCEFDQKINFIDAPYLISNLSSEFRPCINITLRINYNV